MYVNVLVPDVEGQAKDVSAEIFQDSKPLALLSAQKYEWTKFFEPFGQSSYWQGPEYKARAEAGIYTIHVFSTENNSKYSLAIGEVEAFDIKEGINALSLIPDLKRNFFNESPISFIRSPFGWGYILGMYLLAFIAGFVYRSALKRFTKSSARRAQKNIGRSDRIVRLVLWLGLLLWAITTSWSPILLFFSGFALFESLFSWCGFYAAIGKNKYSVD